MIRLNYENKSSLGDDTFWCWMEREFECAPMPAEEGDIVIQYSTKGAPPKGVKSIGLLWELYPEMKRVLGGRSWDDKIATIHACAASCDINVVPTELVASQYPDVDTTVVPIGVDFDLFRPRDKAEMRRKYGLPESGRIGFWCGTKHPMKGADTMAANGHLADHWVRVWKGDKKQHELAELMSACDFALVSGRLRPYFLVEYEAMATDLPLVIVGEPDKDFVVSDAPRQQLKDKGWDRKDCVDTWKKLIARL